MCNEHCSSFWMYSDISIKPKLSFDTEIYSTTGSFVTISDEFEAPKTPQQAGSCSHRMCPNKALDELKHWPAGSWKKCALVVHCVLLLTCFADCIVCHELWGQKIPSLFSPPSHFLNADIHSFTHKYIYTHTCAPTAVAKCFSCCSIFRK